ncbi:MAG: helicase [Proteobacteria bacterium]|nr:helicase [Pseudomonadota bacterium]MCP4916937.1 helicase [Pseudomonadota bacterium]
MRDARYLVESGGRITALLGPTNTGKTHRAIQRMLAHRSGMIGLPLRLLAQEIYDRVCKAKGPDQVALVTGEQKLIPPAPRYWICTVEAMPVDRNVAFLAVDEIQLAGHPLRGHVFTDRLLNARGVLETMFLGSDTIRPLVEQLVPTATITRHERLSRLSFAGVHTVGTLPKRSAVVAFSQKRVYQLAERVRARHGGVAVVLGALSPSARNAQVELFQSGEVDHVVATDAIGMGLNMDLDHVSLAATRKWDGRTFRDLRLDELGQIVGRAGRFRRDGGFGWLDGVDELDSSAIRDLEAHRFQPLRRLFWRNSDLDWSSSSALLDSLDAPPHHGALVQAPEAEDHTTFRALAQAVPLSGEDDVRLAWSIAGIPDYRKTLTGSHVQLLERLLRLVRDRGEVPETLLAERLDRLDTTHGDIEELTTRLAWSRTWAYVVQRPSWVRNAPAWQRRLHELEDRLSDALHETLTQRFVETRRTVRPGAIRTEGGELRGLRWVARPGASPLPRGATRAALLETVRERIETLDGLTLGPDGAVMWADEQLARLTRGKTVHEPKLKLTVNPLMDAGLREALRQRVAGWLDERISKLLRPLRNLDRLEAPGRAVVYRLLGQLGQTDAHGAPRLSNKELRLLKRRDVRFGRRTIYVKRMLRDEAVALRASLWAVHAGVTRPAVPQGEEVSLDAPRAFYESVGYVVMDDKAVRVDIAETRAAERRRGRRRHR